MSAALRSQTLRFLTPRCYAEAPQTGYLSVITRRVSVIPVFLAAAPRPRQKRADTVKINQAWYVSVLDPGMTVGRSSNKWKARAELAVAQEIRRFHRHHDAYYAQVKT